MFGPLRLTREALEYDGEVLPWNRFNRASCSGPMIAFYQNGFRGAWLQMASDEVPNLRLLLTLVGSVRNTAAWPRARN